MMGNSDDEKGVIWRNKWPLYFILFLIHNMSIIQCTAKWAMCYRVHMAVGATLTGVG